MMDNFRLVGDSESEVHESIMDMLDALEPKDRERFAQWGYPHQQSTPENCWGDNSSNSQDETPKN